MLRIGTSYWEKGIGAALLFAALLTFALTARVLDPEHSTYRALGPWPDGPEYVDAGRNWAETGSLRIHVAGELLPARFPPGYSLLLAGFELIVFLDRRKLVTKVVPRMRPSRLAMSLRAHSVLELAAGAAERTGIEKGDQLETRAAS